MSCASVSRQRLDEDYAEPGSALSAAVVETSGSRTFVMNEITVHKRTSVTTSRTVENPRSRENADAEPIPPMNAMGATYARNSPETGPPAHAGHMTASPSSGPGSVRPVRRPVATTWNARANTRPDRSDSANAPAIEYGRNCMPNEIVGAQAIPGP